MVGFDADDGVLLGVKTGVAAEYVDGDGVFLDLSALASKMLIAKVGEKPGNLGRTLERLRFKQAGKFRPLL